MTTNQLDYATEFVSLRPNENQRSVAECLEISRTGGYSTLTDDEIDALMTYRESIAMQRAYNDMQLQLLEDNNNSTMNLLAQIAEKDAMLQRYVNMDYMTFEQVTFNE